jgi:Tfp pilus assembly protein PilF
LAKAIKLDKDYLVALEGYAEILLNHGENQRLIKNYHRALESDPKNPTLCNELGVTYAQVGDTENALTYLNKAIALSPKSVESLLNRGLVYEQMEQPRQAIEDFKKVLSADPTVTTAYSKIAHLYAKNGRYNDALATLQLGLKKIGPNVEHFEGLGGVHTLIGRLDEAENYYRKALAIDDSHTRTILGLANIEKLRGNHDSAYQILRPLLDENNIDAVLQIIDICPKISALKEIDCDTNIAFVEDRIDAPESLTPAQLTQACFALGGIYDKRKDYKKAFTYFQKGNELKKTNFNSEKYTREIDRIIASFSAANLSRYPKSANTCERPLFVVGMPRSGTSLVEQILASHPEVFGAGELINILQMYFDLNDNHVSGRDLVAGLTNLPQSVIETYSENYLKDIDDMAQGERYIVDKMPGNHRLLGFIQLLFPKARIIHCRRDPIDTCLSCYFLDFASSHDYEYRFDTLATFYHAYWKIMAHWKTALTLPIFDIHYEHLVSGPEHTIRKLLDFCDLPWDQRCLNFHTTQRGVATASFDQVKQPIYTHSVNRWRNYEPHIRELIDLLQDVHQEYSSTAG